MRTARFRELASAIAKLRADVLVLDGEVAVFDSKFVSRRPPGRPSRRATSTAHAARRLFEDAIAGSDLILPVRRLDPDGARAWKIVDDAALRGGRSAASIAEPQALPSHPRSTRSVGIFDSY